MSRISYHTSGSSIAMKYGKREILRKNETCIPAIKLTKIFYCIDVVTVGRPSHKISNQQNGQAERDYRWPLQNEPRLVIAVALQEIANRESEQYSESKVSSGYIILRGRNRFLLKWFHR